VLRKNFRELEANTETDIGVASSLPQFIDLPTQSPPFKPAGAIFRDKLALQTRRPIKPTRSYNQAQH